MQSIILAATTTGVAKTHRLKGKSNAIKEDDPRMVPIREHFTELLGLGEVRATRFVSAWVNGQLERTTRDDDNEEVYLPLSSGYRPCYYRYMRDIGYIAKPDAKGRVKITTDPKFEGDMEQCYIDLRTYVRIWKRDYPKLKVSKPAEDICELCFRFANRHRFLAKHKRMSPDETMINSGEHDALFREFDDDGGYSSEEEEEEYGDGADESKEEPAAEGTGQPTQESAADGEVTVNVGSVDAPKLTVEERAEAARRRADLVREAMLVRAGKHVLSAQAQRHLYRNVAAVAVADAKAKKPHSQRHYAFVADYGQNMEVPVYHKEQPVSAYYYSPASAYNFGVVNHAHEYEDGTIGEHLYAHVYHEGIAKKGANNVASLLMKTFRDLNLLREEEMGGELSIVFDNCSGQNKNNTVLKLLVFLVEMKYFEKVNFIFLVVGHTKNAADHLFNALKFIYRQDNIYTFTELLEKLDGSDKVTVCASVEEDFLDYDTFLGYYHSTYAQKMKQNHIFSCSQANWNKNKFHVELRKSDLPEDKIVHHNSIKSGFHGRKQNYPMNSKGLKTAIANRPKDIKAAMADLLKTIEAPGLNPYKQVELYCKYRPIVPHEHHGDVFYKKPSKEVFALVKKEKKSRQDFRGELNKVKADEIRKEKIKAKLGKYTEGPVKKNRIAKANEDDKSAEGKKTKKAKQTEDVMVWNN